MGLAAGLRATVRHVVTEADTAIEAGSGDVPVLATPRLLALAEAACVAALESHLDEGMTSVGTGVALEHRQASPVGAEIEVEAELTELAGRRLVFGFVARHVRPVTGGPAGSEPGVGPALRRAFDAGVPYLVNVITDPAVAYPRSTTGV